MNSLFSRLPVVVLDTNVVLDWLVFEDLQVQPLAHALRSGQVDWLMTPPMRAELSLVLRRPQLGRWQPDAGTVLETVDALARPVAPQPAPQAPRCRDASDQMFIDLACTAGAQWLFTRDNALLSLARHARRHGVTVTSPRHWPGL